MRKSYGFREYKSIKVGLYQSLGRLPEPSSYPQILVRRHKNISVPKEQIFEKLKLLFDNTHFWIQNHTYPFDEIGVRFHHQLVAIHPFPNGNGRHARLMTDVLLKRNKHKPFTWGKADLCGPRSRVRKEYIESLKLADQKDFKKLLKFVRS